MGDVSTTLPLYVDIFELLGVYLAILNLVAFHHSNHSLSETVVALGVVVFIEVETKDKRESLPYIGSERTDEGFSDLIPRLVTLSVYQFYQQTAL